ncbi:glycosyltransferase family 9 protein [Salinimicrobium soli]|uniref:glycosyltransferase family 9 protein n=1 Tax=Salinimicrobium soli TaxID=1254399 RepID=UPI003AADFD23
MSLAKHILVIRLSAMGDVAMTVPVVKRVTERFPDVKITFLTKGFLTPLFKNLRNVDVFEADVNGRHKGVAGLKRLSRELQDLGIDAVADLHNVLRSNILKVFFQLSGIPVKQIDKGRQEKKALTRRSNKIFLPLKTTHERYADVFDQLGFPIDLTSGSALSKENLSPRASILVGEEPKKWLGVAPFAQHKAKAYPLDLVKELLGRLEKEENLKIFLFGGGREEEQLLSDLEKDCSNATSVAGKLKFEEELALISNLDAMLSMDSGNGHIAANYGIPVISLWGLTHPYTGFAPFGQPLENSLLPDLDKYPAIPTSVYGKEIPKGYEDVMRTIPSEKVVGKVKELLLLK